MALRTDVVQAAPRRSTDPIGHPRLPYRPALDGLRALAVVAVFAYHANLGWARAGFLGVDVFFVLSGYLITALLLAERRREGRIDLRRFWFRRARRLLPAVMVLLAVVAVVVPLLARDQVYRLRGDLLAALSYVSNWRLIFAEQSYFQSAGRPPILQHLWSLAVEEQFYLLWPPVLLLALRRRPARRLVVPLLVAAGVSAVLMAVLYKPYADPSRVYFGTDTRAAAPLIGAALACLTVRWQLIRGLRRGGLRVVEVVGLVGLAGLVWAISHVDEFDPLLYRGGFLAVALLAGAVVVAAARPGEPLVLGTLLGGRPLVWLGKRSYAVYLWFWPVMMLTRPTADVPLTGLPLLALRIALTLALATLSYRFVERPAHHGALGRMWEDVRRARRSRAPVRRRTAVWGLGLSATVTCLATGLVLGHGGLGTGPGEEAEVVEAGGLNSAVASKLKPSAPPTTGVSPVTATTATVTTTAAPTTVPVTEPPTTVATVPVSLPTVQADVTAIGDSVLLGAKPLLEHQVEGIVVDAGVGRQFSAILSTVRSYRDNGRLGSAVIIQTGNNGPITGGQFDQLMEALRGVGKVLVVNVKVDRPWQDPNNDVLAEGVSRWPNSVLVDWHAIATAHDDVFYDDGLHLTTAGIRLFVGAVLAAL